MVRQARQDAVLLRRMTTTALGPIYIYIIVYRKARFINISSNTGLYSL